MRLLLKSLLPKHTYRLLREWRRQHLEQRYFKQDFTQIKCGAFEIEAPENHSLVGFLKSQPYRDLCVGVAAKYISTKYSDGTIIDIGANIGDTAAVIATYTRNKLILIEANDYFFNILVRNASRLPNETVTKKVLISDGSEVTGRFHYGRGTTSFYEEAEGKTQIKTQRLSDIADEKTRFVKTDTDGYDFKILTDSLEWLASVHPAVLFENQIRNSKDLAAADKLFADLMQIGYAYFIVWDDPGFHLVSTTSLDVLRDLNRYLFKIWQYDGIKSIYNYDVLCMHQNDEDVYEAICEWCKTY